MAMSSSAATRTAAMTRAGGVARGARVGGLGRVRAASGAGAGAGAGEARRAVRAMAVHDPATTRGGEASVKAESKALKGGGARERASARARGGAFDDGFDDADADEDAVRGDGDDLNWSSAVKDIERDDGSLDDAYKRVLFMTPEDGFIMGAKKTLYHSRGCPCPTCNVFRCRVRNGVDANDLPVEVVVISETEFETLKSVGSFKDMTKVEQLRRRKIGDANAGKVPWNKGGRHSKKTIEKIRATTLKHMQDPEYRERLKRSYNCANARHSAFTRAKIKRASVDRAKAKKIEKMTLESEEVWGRKRGNNGLASSGLFCRRNSAVITVSFGVNGSADIERARAKQRDEEKERARAERELRKTVAATIVEKRKALRKEKAARCTATRSSEHRAKISAAIQNKWRDPEYAAKMRKQKRKSGVSTSPSSSSRSNTKRAAVDPAKAKLLAEIKAMYDKAESAVAALQARAASGVAVDPAMLAQATTAASQTRAMMEQVQRSIAIEAAAAAATSPQSSRGTRTHRTTTSTKTNAKASSPRPR